MKLIRCIAAAGIALSLAVSHAQSVPTPGPSNIGGWLFASNFGQWTISEGSTPINGQISWSSPIQCRVTQGGTTFTPFAVGTPITIVDSNPALTEVVTVTSFTTNSLGCSIQAPMTHVHYSYYLKTASAGIQEAINWAYGLQYVVVVTPDAIRLGGGNTPTTGLITNAIGNSNVTILDGRASTLVYYAWNGSHYVVTGGGGGGGAPNQVYPFTNATSITVLGSTHGFGNSNLIAVVKDAAGNQVMTNQPTIDQSTFNVTVTWNNAFTGYLVLNGGS